MLEEKITQLNSSIIELTSVIMDIAARGQIEKPEHVEKTKIKTETEKPKTNTETETTADDLTKICLSLVRDNPKNNKKIKTIIADFGGELIKDVPVERFADLKIALEAI